MKLWQTHRSQDKSEYQQPLSQNVLQNIDTQDYAIKSIIEKQNIRFSRHCTYSNTQLSMQRATQILPRDTKYSN